MKKRSNSLKNKAWKLFSKYIRIRDCIKKTNTPYYGFCITCGKGSHINELQAGHFIQGRHNSLLFNPKNCHAQCFQCNYYKHGNLIPYNRRMQDMYGDEVINELYMKDKYIRQIKSYEYEALISELEEAISQMVETNKIVEIRGI